MKLSILFFTVSILFNIGLSQDQPHNGTPPSYAKSYLLKNATIIVSPEKTIKNGFLLIEDGKIKDIGTVLIKPHKAVEIDCKGKTIIPAFIDLNTELGIQKPNPEKAKNNSPQLTSNKESFYYWNESVHPEFLSAENYKTNVLENEKLLKSGFGFALTYFRDGIVSGTGSLISLGLHPEKNSLFKPNCSSHFSLNKSANSRQTYPSSQMGSIALLRQTLYDAVWYRKNKNKIEQKNLSLEALATQMDFPLFFTSDEALEILRGQKIANEFKLNFTFYGSGNEYQCVDAIKQTGGMVVLPIDFPDAFDVSDPYINREIPLKELKHWELAPSNPYLLAKAEVPISFTFGKHKSEKEFWNHLREAIKRGLTYEQALSALTLVPSKTLGVEIEVGTLDPGKIASFSIYDRNPFVEEAELLESWTYGYPKIWKEEGVDGISGNYNVLIENKSYSIEITKKSSIFEAKQTNPSKKEFEKVGISVRSNDITLSIKDSTDGIVGNILLHGKINEKVGVFEGEGTDLKGRWVKWNAIRHKKIEADKKEKLTEIDSTYREKIWFPNMAYGFDSLPEKQSFVINNVTAWTNENEGILKEATVVVEDGKIIYVGTGGYPTPSNAVEIDGKGMHLTSGIIDEHSHIAISKGVNEGGQSVSAEVSIGDVVNNTDINIYRQLAGGVTTSQLLHGSANPIGGQSAIIKLKWGYTPEEMLVSNAPKFIKFALGENVKQANWGDNQTVQTNGEESTYR